MIISDAVFEEKSFSVSFTRPYNASSRQRLEISSPTSNTYREYKAGRKTWRVTVNFLVNTSALGVMTMKNIGTTYTLKAYVRNNPSIDYIQGQAILQEAHVTGARGNLVQGSWIFQGTGNI